MLTIVTCVTCTVYMYVRNSFKKTKIEYNAFFWGERENFKQEGFSLNCGRTCIRHEIHTNTDS